MKKEQLKEIRKQLGLTQVQLAEAVGRNIRTIQRQESGEWAVGRGVAEKILEMQAKAETED